MTDQAIYNLLKHRANKAGIARFSPHDLRRSFISELLDRGADIVTVQQLAGHASVHNRNDGSIPCAFRIVFAGIQ